MKRIFYLCLISLSFVFAASCSENKQKQEEKTSEELLLESDSRYDTEMTRSKADTTAILNLVSQYLDLAKQNKIDEALLMLHSVDSTGVQPVSENQKRVIMNNLKRFPVLSYEIDEIRLFSDDNTEVRFTYEFMKKPEGRENLPNTMKGVLSPVRVDGQWYLTISSGLQDPEINNISNSKY